MIETDRLRQSARGDYVTPRGGVFRRGDGKLPGGMPNYQASGPNTPASSRSSSSGLQLPLPPGPPPSPLSSASLESLVSAASSMPLPPMPSPDVETWESDGETPPSACRRRHFYVPSLAVT
ncbi:wiskott-Aldrich syndrome protein family member 1-like [Thrips palmi]|uniref:Wiskott-Aldrich syndrome protein family member 1-like n=1 Tax=Thrips palmi TaxID=161013 RepID=A0A6P8ZBD0_THRPL|nr:wiskott-Aldrich syndrome protein family member 1-like [Thrips palmi]